MDRAGSLTLSTSRNRAALTALSAAGFFNLCSFYLLLPVVPELARMTGKGVATGGAANGALLAASVVGEIASVPLSRRLGYRVLLGVGLVLTGLPALLLIGHPSATIMIFTCTLRGLGFAAAVVASGAWVAEILPPARRGTGLATFGVVVSVPSFLALPIAPWLVDHAGPDIVAVTACILALLGLVGVLVTNSSRPDGLERDGEFGLKEALCRSDILGIVALFAATTAAVGVITSFLSVLVSAQLVATALLVHAVVATLSRYICGRASDRGRAPTLVASVACSGLGIALLAFGHHHVLVPAAMIIFSIGFGAAQNASLLGLLARAPGSATATVTALWDVAYDGGMAIGAAGFGLLLRSGIGGDNAYAVTAGLILLIALAARMAAWIRRESDSRSAGSHSTEDSRSEPAAAVPAGM